MFNRPDALGSENVDRFHDENGALRKQVLALAGIAVSTNPSVVVSYSLGMLSGTMHS